MNSHTYTDSTNLGGPGDGSEIAAITELTGEVIEGILDVGPILGRGGMGVVYQVFHREWNRELAMKIPLHLGGEKFDLKRWIREAHTWIDLGLHPRIVSCWFVRQWREVPVLFLDLYSGGSLKEKLEAREHSPQDTEEWVQVFTWLIHACEGLHHAHTMGLIHRDIKPANLMFDECGNLAVTDFGLGKAYGQHEESGSEVELSGVQLTEKFAGQTEHSLTRTGVMTGTPHYAPPEQWMQKPVGPQADIYALAIVAYQVFTGRHPFEPPGARWDLGKLITAHLMTAAPPPKSFNENLPDSISEFLVRCLAKKAADRPQSLLEFRQALLLAYNQCSGRDYGFPLPQPLSQRADALNNKAVSLWSIGMRTEALSAWAQADRLEPNHLEVTYNRMITSWLAGRKKPAEIEGALRTLGVSSNRGASVWGQYLLARGEHQQAVGFLESALENPGLKEDGTLWRALGEAALGSGDVELATRAYSRAIELIPTDAATRKTLERLNAKKIEPSEGLISVVDLAQFGSLLAWTMWGGERGLALVYSSHLVIIDFLGRVLATAQLPSMNVVSRVESRGYHVIVVGSHEGQLYCFNFEQGALKLSASHYLKQDVQGFIDSDRILLGSTTLQVRLSKDLSQLGTLMVGHEKQVTVHHYLAKQNLLFTGGGDRTIRVWNLVDNQCLAEGRGHRDFVSRIALARQDQLLISGDNSGMVSFWILPKLERLQKIDLNGEITGLRVTGSGQQEMLLVGYRTKDGLRRAAVVLLDRMQIIFDEAGELESWTPGFALWDKSRLSIYSLPECVEWRSQTVSDEAISRCLGVPSYQTIVFWTESQHLISWRLPKSSPSPPPLTLVRANTLSEVQQARGQFSSLMESAWENFRSENWWRAYEDLTLARRVEGYAREQESLELLGHLARKLPRGRLLELWKIRELVHPGRDQAQRLIVSDSGRWAATSSGPLIRLWDLRSGTCIRGMTGHRDEVIGLSFWEIEPQETSGQPPLLFSFSAERSVRLWDSSKGECLQTLVAGSGPAIVTVGFCGQTRFYAFVDRGGRLCTGRWSQSLPFELQSLAAYKGIELPEAVVVGRDGLWLVVVESNCKVFYLDTPDAVPRLELELDYSRALLPGEGKALIGAASGGALEVYDLEQRRVVSTLQRRERRVEAMACTLDGSVLATVDDNGLLEIWLLASKQKVLEKPLKKNVRSVVFSGNDRYLLLLTNDGAFSIWEFEWELEKEIRQESLTKEPGKKLGVWNRFRQKFGF